MNLLRRKSMNAIFRVFENLNFTCYEGEGSGSVVDPPIEVTEGDNGLEGIDAGLAPEEVVDGAAAKEEEVLGGEALYMGSETVNPDGRELIDFDRSGMSKEDVDAFVAVSEGQLFKPVEDGDKEDDAKEGDDNSDDNKNDTGKADGAKDGEGDKGDGDKGGDDTDIADFLEKTGLTQEIFKGLPEAAQEKLATQFLGGAKESEATATVTTQYEELQTSVDTLRLDPVVAARLEELSTGNKFIAELPQMGAADLKVIDDALGEGNQSKALGLINDFIAAKSKDAVAHERSVIDNQAAHVELERGAGEELAKMGDIDPRMKVEGITNWADLKASNPKFAEFQKGPGKITAFLAEKGIGLQQIKKLGAEAIYSLYAKNMGWTQEKEQNIAKNSVKVFLSKLKGQPKTRTLTQGKQKVIPGSKTASTGINRTTLIDELVAGNPANYEKLLEANDGNPENIRILANIQQEAIAKAQAAQTAQHQ